MSVGPTFRKKGRFWLVSLGILLLSLWGTFTPGYAQDPTPGVITDDQVNAIAKQMYCPVCENVPLDVCPTQACAQWRELIREKLAEGWSEKQVKDFFVTQYGARVLAAPPAEGINWLVYLVPPVVILAGLFILYRALSTWNRPARPAVSANAPGDIPADEYVQRLEEELRKRNQ